MFWSDRIAAGLSGEQVVNDSKTPSGRVHVGALRGVIIHDVMFRALSERGLPAKYIFGVDDFDPLDERPADIAITDDDLGRPLCNVPAPAGSTASDIAEHYIREFFEIFRELGVETDVYRMRDVYRSGRFDEAIDVILSQADVVRRIYKEVSGSERAADWLPFQIVCERCGRVGTTEVSDYRDGQVSYRCSPTLVTWAVGCGNQGRVSPFGGAGKLPWKLEWAAKWHVFKVTVEGAGKDHNTRGGSRDVAAACVEKLFGRKAPQNIPYEFFLVGGAKMSSSRGVGAAARDIADLLSPELLRFLLVRPLPRHPVDFEPSADSLVKLFNDFDRHRERAFDDPAAPEDVKRTYHFADPSAAANYFQPPFQLVLAWTQLPHVDLFAAATQRKGAPLTGDEHAHLEHRIQAARLWLERYASPEERLELQPNLPDSAERLGATARAFLDRLGGLLEDVEWDEECIQTAIFDAARLTPIPQGEGFAVIYTVLFDRRQGPKAGNILAFLDRAFVVERFRGLPYSVAAFFEESAETPEVFEAWLARHREQIQSIDVAVQWVRREPATNGGAGAGAATGSLGAVEFVVTRNDGKREMHRVIPDGLKALAEQGDAAVEAARAEASQFAGALRDKYRLPIAG